MARPKCKYYAGYYHGPDDPDTGEPLGGLALEVCNLKHEDIDREKDCSSCEEHTPIIYSVFQGGVGDSYVRSNLGGDYRSNPPLGGTWVKDCSTREEAEACLARILEVEKEV